MRYWSSESECVAISSEGVRSSVCRRHANATTRDAVMCYGCDRREACSGRGVGFANCQILHHFLRRIATTN